MLKELEKELYIDLNPRITSIKESNSGIAIEITCNDWNKGAQRSFLILTKGVVNCSLSLGSIEYLAWDKKNSILADYSSPQSELYFSSSPTDILSVIEIMNDAHTSFYGSIKNFHSPSISLFRGGHGLLSRGPKELMLTYTEKLQELMKISIVDTYSPKLKIGVLLLGESYVICESAEAIEL